MRCRTYHSYRAPSYYCYCGTIAAALFGNWSRASNPSKFRRNPTAFLHAKRSIWRRHKRYLKIRYGRGNEEQDENFRIVNALLREKKSRDEAPCRLRNKANLPCFDLRVCSATYVPCGGLFILSVMIVLRTLSSVVPFLPFTHGIRVRFFF